MKVKFLPKKDIEVEVCEIYEDRDAVIIQHTDTLLENTAYNVEALGFKYGIKPTAYHWPYGGIQNELTDINNTGIIKFGVYIPTDRYRGLSNAGVLPDYTNNTITTQFSADYYGKNIGDPKPARVQQGQDLFDYTNGIKGYDVVNGFSGTDGNMDFIREMEYIDNWYNQNFNRLPSTGADRQGVIGSKEIYMPHYIGIRKTTPDNSLENHEYNDIDRLGFIHKDITSRWENGFAKPNMNEENDLLVLSINRAFEVKGMFNDFVHWHRAITHADDIYKLHDLYELIHNTVNGRNAWYTGYSEAVEYYWFKKMVKRVRASFINDKLYLIADFDDEFFNQQIAGIDKKLLYNRMKQPLSVKIDLTGTIFENQDIISNNGGIISLGNNEYIIDIPFIIAENGFKQVVISETTGPKYKNFNNPNVLNFSNGMITTDQPCRAVLFENTFNETMTVSSRKLELNITHSFELDSNSKYIGLITEYGQSILYDL